MMIVWLVACGLWLGDERAKDVDGDNPSSFGGNSPDPGIRRKTRGTFVRTFTC